MFSKLSAVKCTGFILLLAAGRARAEEAPSFSFAVMGCAHMGICDSKDYGLAVKKIKEQAPDFVVFLGGMVDVFRAKEIEGMWRKFDAITAPLEMPIHNAAGDCSLNPLSVSSGTAKLAAKMHSDRYKKRFYSFEHMNNLFILLDSADKNESGLLGEQSRFLRTTLERAAEYDNVFVFQNQTPPEDAAISPWFKFTHPLLVSKVRYVFTSGAHYFDLTKRDGVNYVISGGPPCQQKQKQTEHPSFFHFLLVTVTAGEVSVAIVPINPILIEHMGGKKKNNPAGKYTGAKPDTLNAAERKLILPPDTVVKALNLKPGMKILDVGAGTGFLTFPFAKALGGTGSVVATEIDPAMIASLEKTIKEKGYKNVVPVRVAAEGVDPFYKTTAFDIIVAAELWHYLWRPVDYFRELRRSLAMETGRLYIISFKGVSDFTEIEFDDFSRILNRLKTLGDKSPVSRKVAAGLEDYAANWQGGDTPPLVRKKIIANLNKLLADRAFLNELLESYPVEKDNLEWTWGRPLLDAVKPRDVQLAKWLITELDERGVFDKGKTLLTEDEEKYLRTLNRALLTGIFGTDKIHFLKGNTPIYAGKKRIIADMETAGYKFVREHDLFTYYQFLEFKNAGD